MSKEDKLIGYLDGLVEKLRQTLSPAVKDGEAAAIHQARVTTRRLKAAVDVFDSISTPSHVKPFAKSLRKLRKHLGPARDLDVMLGHLKEFNSPKLESAVAWLTRQLSDLRQEIHAKAADDFDARKALSKLQSYTALRAEWTEAGDGVHCNIAQSLHLQLDEFIERADVLSQSKAKQQLDPHQLRIVGKALRYTLEMAVAGGHKLPARIGRAFKRMQDALGLWHDFVVLSDCILERSIKTGIGHQNPETAIALLELAKSAVGKADRQLKKFNTLWISSGRELATAIRQAFPLTQAVPISELRMDQHQPVITQSEGPPATALSAEI